jgi:GNAT superfamily N-acetyltransferase
MRIGDGAVTEDGDVRGGGDHGFVGIGSVGPASERARMAAIFGMWVAPEARGQGIGGSLMDALEGWARARRLRRYRPRIDDDERARHHLYEAGIYRRR